MNKEALKQWMKDADLDREGLAKRIGVAEGTLNNWFSKGFPDWGTLAIQRLINPSPSGTKDAGLEVTFTADQFERIEEARTLLGLAKRKEFYEMAITQFTDEILAQEQQGSDEEDPPGEAPPSNRGNPPPPTGTGPFRLKRIIGEKFPSAESTRHGLNESPPTDPTDHATMKKRVIEANARRKS